MKTVQEVSIIGFGYGCAPCQEDLGRKAEAVVSFETYENGQLIRRDHLCGNHAEVLHEESEVAQ